MNILPSENTQADECSEVQALLLNSVRSGSALSADEHTSVREHLSRCNECRRFYQSLQEGRKQADTM